MKILPTGVLKCSEDLPDNVAEEANELLYKLKIKEL
jgi:hypothetical protein